MDAKSPVELAQHWWWGSHTEQDELSAVPSSGSSRAGEWPRAGAGSAPQGRAVNKPHGPAHVGDIHGRVPPAPPQLWAVQTLPLTIRDVADTGHDRG